VKAFTAEQASDYDLAITSYGSLLRIPVFAEADWRVVILDEGQAIKNPNARQTKAAKALKASRTMLHAAHRRVDQVDSSRSELLVSGSFGGRAGVIPAYKKGVRPDFATPRLQQQARIPSPQAGKTPS
jgi:hypothetical protein